MTVSEAATISALFCFTTLCVYDGLKWGSLLHLRPQNRVGSSCSLSIVMPVLSNSIFPLMTSTVWIVRVIPLFAMFHPRGIYINYRHHHTSQCNRQPRMQGLHWTEPSVSVQLARHLNSQLSQQDHTTVHDKRRGQNRWLVRRLVLDIFPPDQSPEISGHSREPYSFPRRTADHRCETVLSIFLVRIMLFDVYLLDHSVFVRQFFLLSSSVQRSWGSAVPASWIYVVQHHSKYP